MSKIEAPTVALLLAFVSSAFSSYGQESRAPLPTFQGAPGARALALGGAFIGVADDATAAESNPSGLTILTRPEVSLHVVRESLGDSSNTRPSFASYVRPMGRGALSVYYSSGVDTSLNFGETNGDSVLAVRDETALRRFGVAGAFRPMPMLSIGAAVGLGQLTRSVKLSDRFPFTFTDAGGVQRNALAEFDDSLEADGNAVHYNVGVLLNPAGRFSLGAVYKKDGKFDGKFVGRLRACAECTLTELRTRSFEEYENQTVQLEGPSLMGAGVSVRPFQGALLAVDYTVQESRASVFVGAEERVQQQIRALRVGAEYLIPVGSSAMLIPIRAGYAREKDPDFKNSDFLREEATTYSLGTGLVFGANQIDIALSRGYTITTDLRVRQIIVSGIHRF